MTRRLPVPPAPGPLESYCQQFDPLFRQHNQRDRFRRYLEGLLLPTERNKTLTALANTEPVVGAQHPHAQSLQWFLSESTWDAEAVNERRLTVLRADRVTAPTADGVLVIDEHGDRKWRSKAVRHNGLTTEETEEVRQLRREVKRLRERREILLTAAAFFAQETGQTPR